MAAHRDTPRSSDSTHQGAVGGSVVAGGRVRPGYTFHGRDVRVPASRSDHRAKAAPASRTPARRAYCATSATELLVTERSA